MKKVFIFLSLLISLFPLSFSNIFAAASWKYVWSNTVVEIPIGDSVENYKDIPYAILYKNNVALTDTNITYNREGDWLYYLKNVNNWRDNMEYLMKQLKNAGFIHRLLIV